MIEQGRNGHQEDLVSATGGSQTRGIVVEHCDVPPFTPYISGVESGQDSGIKHHHARVHTAEHVT
jgi:hypothetical protein